MVLELILCALIQHGKAANKRHWSTKEKRKSWPVDDDVKFGDIPTSSGTESASVSSDSSLWVDSYRPACLQQIIGQQGDKSSARKLYVWLANWRYNFWKKPVCTFTSFHHCVSSNVISLSPLHG